MGAAVLRRRVNLCLALALGLNLMLWWGSRFLYAKWAGVPPVPSRAGAVMMTLGDEELSHRTGALALQNLGDGGGRSAALRDYDYGALRQWFFLLDSLDPASEHVPYIASFYFGAVEGHPEKVRAVIDYLYRAGLNPAGEKWRWLAQAAHLARHRVGDTDLALEIAYALSRMQLSGGRALPAWAKEYPAFILKAQGEKDSARALMERLLLTEENLPPNEVNFMASFLVEQVGVPQAEVDALLEKRKGK